MLDESLVKKIINERSVAFNKLFRLQDWSIFISVGKVDDGTNAAENLVKIRYLTSEISINLMNCTCIKETIDTLLHEMLHLWTKELHVIRWRMSGKVIEDEPYTDLVDAEEAIVVRATRFMSEHMPEKIYGKWYEKVKKELE